MSTQLQSVSFAVDSFFSLFFSIFLSMCAQNRQQQQQRRKLCCPGHFYGSVRPDRNESQTINSFGRVSSSCPSRHRRSTVCRDQQSVVLFCLLVRSLFLFVGEWQRVKSSNKKWKHRTDQERGGDLKQTSQNSMSSCRTFVRRVDRMLCVFCQCFRQDDQINRLSKSEWKNKSDAQRRRSQARNRTKRWQTSDVCVYFKEDEMILNRR